MISVEEHGDEELAKECDGFTLNRGMMAEPSVDRFKVWPTQLDRAQFEDVILSGSRTELERHISPKKAKVGTQGDPQTSHD